MKQKDMNSQTFTLTDQSMQKETEKVKLFSFF